MEQNDPWHHTDSWRAKPKYHERWDNEIWGTVGVIIFVYLICLLLLGIETL